MNIPAHGPRASDTTGVYNNYGTLRAKELGEFKLYRLHSLGSYRSKIVRRVFAHDDRSVLMPMIEPFLE
jgi:hypothetical protein